MLLEISVTTGDRPSRMNFIREHFPYGANEHIVGFDFERNVVRIHLAEKPDYEQSRWLMYERDDEEIITSFNLVDDAPHAEPQPSLIDAILATLVHQVPSNGNTRFYMEPEVDKRWDSLHHLVDLHDNGVMDSKLTVHQFNSSNESSSVHLSYNEVDELLAILLQWRMSHEDKRVEDAKPENALGDLNGHPF